MSDSVVPDIYVAPLLRLQEITEEQFGDLVGATESIGKPSGIGTYLDVAESSGIETGTAAKIVETLLSILAFQGREGLDLEEMIDGISSSETLDLSDSESERLAERIKQLIGHGMVIALHKSFDISFSHERLFLDSQITSDIRPVFGDEIEDGMAAVVLTHSLRIDFIQAGRKDSVYVTLDPSDLSALHQVVERASAKADSIATTLEDAGIANLTWSE